MPRIDKLSNYATTWTTVGYGVYQRDHVWYVDLPDGSALVNVGKLSDTTKRYTMSNIENLIAAMLTENTGTHFLDSGGASGRAWQRNQGQTVESLRAQPSAVAEVYVSEFQGQTTVGATYCKCISFINQRRVDDKLCDEFNAMPVEDWHGDYYGVSTAGQEWLNRKGFEEKGQAFNTYNWAANHSQTLQGQELELNGDNYMLIQIHGGADVRGGYTDAKLFKLDDHAEYYNVINEDCGFSDANGDISLNWHGEWINQDGGCATDDDLLEFATAWGVTIENGSKTIPGDAYLDF